MDNLRALKLIGLMGGLSDEIKKIEGITNVAKFKAGEYAFKEETGLITFMLLLKVRWGWR